MCESTCVCVCVCVSENMREADRCVCVFVLPETFCIFGSKLFQRRHSLALIIVFCCGGLTFRVTYSCCSVVNTGHLAPSLPGFLTKKKKNANGDNSLVS